MKRFVIGAAIVVSAGCVGANGADCAPEMDAGSAPGPKRMFITAARYPGDFGSEGGIDEGDRLCQLEADARAIGGSWRAWLSGCSHAIDRIGGAGPWVNMQGETVFANREALEVTAPAANIAYDAAGEEVRDNGHCADFWSGSTQRGLNSGDDCAQWTGGGSGTVGDTCAGTDWAFDGLGPCTADFHLVCFEQ